MRRKIYKIIIFIVVFLIVFGRAQSILHYKWSASDDLYTKNLLYQNQAENSIDILFFGTSEIYAGVFPAKIYNQSGITSYNFAISHKSAITTYYQLEYALKYQTPDIIVCDFASLFTNSLPNDSEAVYRKVVDTMPDYDIKYRLIKDMCKEDDTQSALSYYFPLLRYHGMWSELTEKDFKKDYAYNTKYKQYKLGCYLSNAGYDASKYKQEFVIEPDLWQVESNSDYELAPVSIRYYDKMIELCNSRSIKVVALMPPKISGASLKVSQWDAMKGYFESRNVDVIDYNTYEAVCGLNLVLEEDYYDAAHLNYKGAVKFSEDLAEKLSEKYSLIDHRDSMEDEKYAMWNTYWDTFIADYPEFDCKNILIENNAIENSE